MNQKILLIKMITKTVFCNKIDQLIIIQLDINALNSHEILYEVFLDSRYTLKRNY